MCHQARCHLTLRRTFLTHHQILILNNHDQYILPLVAVAAITHLHNPNLLFQLSLLANSPHFQTTSTVASAGEGATMLARDRNLPPPRCIRPRRLLNSRRSMGMGPAHERRAFKRVRRQALEAGEDIMRRQGRRHPLHRECCVIRRHLQNMKRNMAMHRFHEKEAYKRALGRDLVVEVGTMLLEDPNNPFTLRIEQQRLQNMSKSMDMEPK